MILGIQILGICFGIFMIYYTYLQMKRKQFSRPESLTWIIIWLGFIWIVMFPKSMDFLVKGVLGISRTFDFFVVSGFLVMIALTFYNYSVVRRNQNKLEEIVRKLAFKKADKKEEKRN